MILHFLRTTLIAVAFCLSLGLTSHGQDKNPAAAKATVHEEIAMEFMDVLEEMNNIILTATDLKSSKKAAGNIIKLQAKVDAIAERLKTMEPPTNEEKKAIEAKMQAHDGTVDNAMGEKLQQAMLKLSDNSQRIISKAMSAFYQNLDKHDGIFRKHFKPAN
jgi:hypothetical protein